MRASHTTPFQNGAPEPGRRHHDHHDGGHDRGFGPEAHRARSGRGFGPGFPGAGGFGGFGPRGFMPPGQQRKRKGDVRIAIVSLLWDKPSNGYNLIKQIAERSGGTWNPSPGSVYPTLQQLVDEELIESVGEGRATEFRLTEAGKSFVSEHSEEMERVWETSDARAEADAGLHESVGKLMGVVHQFRFAATEEQRAKAVTTLDDARRALYAILAD
jgi:DNA-binding PadR family transcriptional regulator